MKRAITLIVCLTLTFFMQGQILKKARFEYKNSLQLNSKKYPFISLMEIQDVKQSEYRSLISYSDLKVEKFKTAEFNINNVRK